MRKEGILFLSVFALAVSCTDKLNEFEAHEIIIESKSAKTGVSLIDMQTVASAILGTVQTRGVQETEFTIQPYVYEEKDTLLYVVQQEKGGWTIYAADKRIPPILATSDEGFYEKAIEIDAAKTWIDAIAMDVKAVKQCKDEELKIPIEEQKKYQEFWTYFCDPITFLKNQSQQRLPPPSIIIPDFYGHYELINSYSTDEYYGEIAHLTSTSWRQQSPYNDKCPYTNDTYTIHSPAGCVAVAAAQMLYYLHYKFGVPETAPSTASVTGTYSSYTMNQGDYNSSVWDEMTTNPAATAPLIANVGQRIGTTYGESSSSANPSNLPNYVFAPYGINCTTNHAYNTNELAQSLLDSIPVILSAKYNETIGHTFICDGYKLYRTKYTSLYEWVYDDDIPDMTILPHVSPKTEITYSLPYVQQIAMNWGDANGSSDIWFTLNGDWIFSNHNFQYNRTMISGFTPSN